jgi:1-acyl-sn-glycerol-3-phosphate acyltransferase
MRILGIFISFIYRLYFGIIFFSTGIIFLPFFLLLVNGRLKYKLAFSLKKIWSKTICILVFVKVKVEGKENFPKDSAYVICPNHSSYLDIIIMYLVVPKEFAFLGKAEVLRWPIINLFFKRGIDIPVYRFSVKRLKECLVLAKTALLEGRSIAIFPEGGWQDRSKKLRRFKNGAFILALETKSAVVPITFKNNFDLFTDHSDFGGFCRPGIARVVVHKPLNPKTYIEKDLISLRNQTYHIIKKELNNEIR